MELDKKIACLVLSYCLYKDGTRLSKMAEESARLGIEAVCNGEASHIIFSTAYDRPCWEKEAELKKTMALKKGIKSEQISFLEGVTRTSDEVSFLKAVLSELKPSKLLVICEKQHIRRATRFLEKGFPWLEIEIRSFQSKYERTLEPFPKGHRGSFVTWWLWCFLCNLFNK